MKQSLFYRNLLILAAIVLATSNALASNLACWEVFETPRKTLTQKELNEQRRADRELNRSADLAFINAEFSRKPDDSKDKNGEVTDRVPITVPSILAGYSRGLFPWKVTPEGNGIWYNPPNRGLLYLRNEKWGFQDGSTLKRLYKQVEKGQLVIRRNYAFEEVMRKCAAQKRKLRNASTGQLAGEPEGTWISEEFVRAFTALSRAGFARSVEIWRGGVLVGGTYGVKVNGVFTGESMFHDEDDVAKLAFDVLRNDLLAEGDVWADSQVAPPDSKSLTVKWGAADVDRDQVYLPLLRARHLEIETSRANESLNLGGPAK